MPSSATITAFYTFMPGKKARSTQLNNNFGIYRGHILPIDPNTDTASDQTYSLGTSDYRWATAYVNQWSFSISLGASHVFQGTTSGGFKFEKSSMTTAEFSGTYFVGKNNTPANPTTTAIYGGVAQSAPLNTTITANGFISGSTCTISTNGRPVFVGLMPVGGTTGNTGLFVYDQTITVGKFQVRLSVYYEGASTIVGTDEVGVGYTTTSINGGKYNFGPCTFGKIFYPSADTHTFQLYLESTSTTYSNFRIELKNMRLVAYEI